MILENLPKHEIKITGRDIKDFNWKIKFNEFTIPGKAAFKVEGLIPIYGVLKKVVWNFGDSTKEVVQRNKTEESFGKEVEHGFKPKNIPVGSNTINIQASVYTSNDMFIPHPFEIIVKNPNDKRYIDPVIFKQQIENYYKTGKQNDEIAIAVYQIANRLAFAPNFINYTYREEMIGDALVKMYEALYGKKFKPDKGNPFSYFTKIAFHAFCNRIKKEKRLRDALSDYQEEVFHTLVNEKIIPADFIQNSNSQEDDYVSEDF